MTVIFNKNVAHAIYLASKDKNPEEQSLVFKKVAQFLIRKRLLSKTKEILSFLNKIINEQEGRIEAKVSSVEKINDKMKRELTQTLTHRYKAKEIKIVENLDKRLLGGFKVEVGDEVIDLTLRNRIDKLQEHLTSEK